MTAIDVATGTEVVFQAPVSASQMAIKRIATDKISFVLAKDADKKS